MIRKSILLAASVLLLPACKEDKSEKEKVTNPSKLELAQHFRLGGWYVGIPIEQSAVVGINDLPERPDDTQVKSGLLLKAFDGAGKLREFEVDVRADRCANYKTSPGDGEIMGEEDRGFWFITNSEDNFLKFSWNRNFYNHCLSASITPKNPLQKLSSSSELTRYFRVMLNESFFDRLSWLDAKELKSEGFKVPILSNEEVQLTESEDGISKTELDSIFVSTAGETVTVKESIAIGDCSAFAGQLEDKTRRNLSPAYLEVASYKVATDKTSETNSELNIDGFFKLSGGGACMSIVFATGDGAFVGDDEELKNHLLNLLVGVDQK